MSPGLRPSSLRPPASARCRPAFGLPTLGGTQPPPDPPDAFCSAFGLVALPYSLRLRLRSSGFAHSVALQRRSKQHPSATRGYGTLFPRRSTREACSLPDASSFSSPLAPSALARLRASGLSASNALIELRPQFARCPALALGRQGEAVRASTHVFSRLAHRPNGRAQCGRFVTALQEGTAPPCLAPLDRSLRSLPPIFSRRSSRSCAFGAGRSGTGHSNAVEASGRDGTGRTGGTGTGTEADGPLKRRGGFGTDGRRSDA